MKLKWHKEDFWPASLQNNTIDISKILAIRFVENLLFLRIESNFPFSQFLKSSGSEDGVVNKSFAKERKASDPIQEKTFGRGPA